MKTSVEVTQTTRTKTQVEITFRELLELAGVPLNTYPDVKVITHGSPATERTEHSLCPTSVIELSWEKSEHIKQEPGA